MGSQMGVVTIPDTIEERVPAHSLLERCREERVSLCLHVVGHNPLLQQLPGLLCLGFGHDIELSAHYRIEDAVFKDRTHGHHGVGII